MKKEDPVSTPEEEEKREKPTYITQTILGIIGGILLVITTATGAAVGLTEAVDYLIEQNILSPDVGNMILRAITFLVMGGGFTVIVGSLLLNTKLRSIGTFLIDIGAGVSLFSLILRIVAFGPTIQTLYEEFIASGNAAPLVEAFQILGFEIGLVGLGVLLAFLATFIELKWPALLSFSSILAILAGITADPTPIRRILNTFNLSQAYVSPFIRVLRFYGVFLLIVALLYGMGWKLLSKILLLLGITLALTSIASLLIALPTVISTFGLTGFPSVFMFLRVLAMVGVLGITVLVIAKG
ncbi:MAG: hypothetical protein GWO20_16225 [Candidatus Korarchaeota archaeon]|nr:hypothetical protein [Candidatus Korarchaeota archaeon]NIU84959.1 hypothetical protein [Candidatus Thorarchaeota archaeon]NIW14982.1 hypothetical protein [Candidatus Thorarchaeota archaeon]NIW52992.1 hypothetical protein [Candidatus Korarchaeota archaeon]